ncbi:CHAT domain-containing protein [Gaetbulibacter sp. M240]|uniref:CHAT domain-containing protein n=1 Tax=Gaetbulibacter sp. M240 TaxID=3126511 RepID=UPI00374E5017
MFRYLIIFFFAYSFTVCSQENNNDEKITSYFYEGYNKIYTQKDSAYYFFDKALYLADQLKDYETQLQLLSYKVFTSGYHYDMTVYRNSLDEILKIMQVDSLSSKVKDLNLYKQQLLLDTGNYYYKLKDYSRAKPYFIEAYSELSKIPKDNRSMNDQESLLSVYNFLASIYKNTGKYDLAELYYNRSNQLSKVIYEGDNLAMHLASTNKLKAQLYNNSGKLDKAHLILKDVIGTHEFFYKKDKKYKNNLVSVYQTMVENSIEKKDYKTGLSYLKACESILLPEDPFYKKSLILYGTIYSKMGKDEKALEYYNSALKAFLDYHQTPKHIDVARVFAKLSRFYLDRNNSRNGLEYIEKALQSLDYKGKNKASTVPALLYKRELLHFLDLKNQNLVLAFNLSQDQDYLNQAIKVNVSILELFGLLKKEFESKLDKEFLSNTAYPIFNRMMDITYLAYSLSPNKDLLTLALNISEKNKDIFLLDAFRDSNATRFNNVPESILDQEALFKSNLNNLEKTIFSTKDTIRTKKLKDDLFILKNNYYLFLDSISVKYPNYYNLNYQEKNITLNDLRSSIIDLPELIISYKLTEDNLYTIAINKNKEVFTKTTFSSEERKLVSSFYNQISKVSLQKSDQLNEFGRALYNTLLSEILIRFEEKSLIIIPDGLLHYVPFEVLTDSTGDYLLFEKKISYNSSISSLTHLKAKKTGAKSKLIAFAPDFKWNEKGSFIQSPLLHNKLEVEGISRFFETNSFMDQEATLTNFKSNASMYNIIHLATHASANDEFPDYSYLAFSASDTKDHTLYIKDLYNTQINADLVTLSACQTGIGKLRNGEGMISLSKGFYYAGAKSLVKSLWKINDKSTSLLMEAFYRELNNGKSKDEALRLAKINYLKTVDDDLLKHPYYWAAFIVSGDISPLRNHYSWWYFGLLALIIVSVTIFIGKKNKV